MKDTEHGENNGIERDGRDVTVVRTGLDAFESEGGDIRPLSSRERSATVIGMGLVGGAAPAPPDMETWGPSASQSKLEMLAESYSGGGDRVGDGGGREGIQNYLMKADSYRFLRGSSKNMAIGPARKGRGGSLGGGGGGRRGRGGRGRGGTIATTSVPSRQSAPNSTIKEDNPVPLSVSGTEAGGNLEHYIERCSYVYVFITFIGSSLFPISLVM